METNNMNKQEIVEKMNSEIKKIDDRFSVIQIENDVVLRYESVFSKGMICWFSDFKFTKFYAPNPDEKLDSWLMTDIIMTGIAHRFYELGTEMLEDFKPEYTIQTIKNDDRSFLHLDLRNNKFFYYPIPNSLEDTKNTFSKDDINNMKANPDLAIDWDKVKYEEVDTDE